MPIVSLGEARIRYDDIGAATPLLCLAPGGLSGSRADFWARAPWDPREVLSPSYRVIAMDQRNTGTSWAPVTSDDGWRSYARDQLALMDHLGIDRFAVMGMCIGGAFIAQLCAEAPERVAAAVALQPIGAYQNQETFMALFDRWAAEVKDQHPEADASSWAGMRENLFGTPRLTWSQDEGAASEMSCPLLVLQGDDEYHPREVSERWAAVTPGAALVTEWKEPSSIQPGVDDVISFLSSHWPAG